MKNRNVITYAGGGGPAEPVLSKQSVLTDDVKSNAKGEKPAEPVLSKQSVLTDDVKSNVKDGAPAPVRVSETGRARNWTMPPLRLERECKEHSAEQNDLLSFCERRNSATIDNRCVEFDRRENQCCAFTMAEILLSLTIIGVVAAITLPSLTGNINERTWNTQRKALYARFSQAMPLIDSLNGYANAETFITGALGKVIKINNICDKEHLSDCGIASTFVNLAASTLDIPTTLNELNPALTSVDLDLTASGSSHYIFSGNNTDAAAFETGNGESIVVYYNPTCVGDMGETDNYYVQRKICAHFIYDLNGSKGPNTVNKDIGFMTAIYPTGTVVAAPFVHPQDASTALVFYDEAAALCTQQDAEYRMPNLWELISMMAARKMIGEDKFKDGYNTSALLQHQNTLLAWRLFVDVGAMTPVSKNMGKYKVRCVHR